MQSDINWGAYFIYDADTGKIFWKVKPKYGKVKAGDEAGSQNKRGYICIWLNGKSYRANRIAWCMANPGEELSDTDEVDHINHVLTDNRAINLRKVSRLQNNQNASRRKDNSSGVTGVYWNRINQRWTAQIVVAGVYNFLGNHLSLFDAICARKSAEIFFGFHENHGSAPVK